MATVYQCRLEDWYGITGNQPHTGVSNTPCYVAGNIGSTNGMWLGRIDTRYPAALRWVGNDPGRTTLTRLRTAVNDPQLTSNSQIIGGSRYLTIECPMTVRYQDGTSRVFRRLGTSCVSLTNLSSPITDIYWSWPTSFTFTASIPLGNDFYTTRSYTINWGTFNFRTAIEFNQGVRALGLNEFELNIPTGLVDTYPSLVCISHDNPTPVRTNLTPIGITQFETTFGADETSKTVNIGDRLTGDMIDVICHFPDNVVNGWYAFNPNTLDDYNVLHVSVDEDNNQVRIRLQTKSSDLEFGLFNLTFNPSGQQVTNYAVRLFQT